MKGNASGILRSRNMRRAIPLIGLAIAGATAWLLLTLASPVSADDTVVRVTDGAAAPGGQVTVQLRVENIHVGTLLGGATVNVSYDSTVLSAASCAADPDGLFATALCNPNAGPNTVGFTAFSLSGVTGNAALADITFDVDPSAAAGPTTLSVSVVTLADTGGTDIPHATQDGVITVTGVATPTATATPVTPTDTPTATAIPTGCTPGQTCVLVTDDTAPPGGQATVQLRAENIPAGSLGGATVNVSYDSTVLSAASCDADPDGLFSTALCNPNAGPNTVGYTAFSLSGVSGDVALADITFDVDPGAAAGPTTLNVSVVTFADTGGVPIPHATQDGVITIVIVTPTSTPTPVTPTSTPTPVTPTNTPTPVTPTNTPTPTPVTPTNTPTPTPVTPTNTPTPTPVTPTNTPTPTGTPSPCAPGQACVLVTDGVGVPGGQATVQLRAENIPAGSLGSATVDVSYDSSVLTAAGCADDPANVFDFAGCNPNFDPNTVRFSGISASGVSGDVALADLTFDVDASAILGSTTILNVSVVTFEDTGGVPISHGVQDGTISIGRTGDGDCDGDVDSTDALFVLQYVLGFKSGSNECPPPAGSVYLPAADVDDSGDVTSTDALFILQCVLNLPLGNGLPFCTALP